MPGSTHLRCSEHGVVAWTGRQAGYQGAGGGGSTLGWHGMPSPFVAGTVSDGMKMAITLLSAVIMMIILIVLVIIVILAVVEVLSGPAGGCKYRKHGPLWRRRYRAVPASDQDGKGMLTVREEQLWDDLATRYDTDAAADPWRRGGAR